MIRLEKDPLWKVTMSFFQVVVRVMIQLIILLMYLYHHCGKGKAVAAHAVDQDITRYDMIAHN
jgi:hypothetical protein